MDVFKQINYNELVSLLEKQTLTRNDRFLIDSFTTRTLVNECGDLRSNELMEVYKIERDNIYRFMFSAITVFGVGGAIDDVLKFPISQDFLSEIIEMPNTDKEKEIMFVQIFTKLILSGSGDISKPSFVGKMPQKLFSFRQLNAETWFKDYVNFRLHIIGIIYDKMGLDETVSHIFSNTAYYLNKSQTFKYYQKSTDKDLNDSLGRILIEFCHDCNGDTSILSQKPEKILFKDL